jgi:hypothetical protein
MIAWASMHRFIAGNTDDYAILIRPKWSIQDLMDDDEPPGELCSSSSSTDLGPTALRGT